MSLFDVHQISLFNLKRQTQLTKKYELPLIVVKTNIFNELDQSEHANFVYKLALEEVQKTISAMDATVIEYDDAKSAANLESLFVVRGVTTSNLKRAMVKIENNHPLGSLINIDIIDCQGYSVSRRGTQMESRKCILCDHPASYCATNHRHSIQEIKDQITLMIEQY
ncbi:citrate lyase holo-[acyl-carrier protein] synthase [Vibrio ziniensis]|uniref:citrate lyase holo-[acyl-carrier protein] synthase n=1 Tax=Vibrio ziniensis TaxID=2711221 RepID=A0A6G7CJ14_9VIBR|nr:citrate lyase holo-[acyl-carrier protein] synthase [Vibrio ziniensis]QIH42060.1 citrate lyase holo-[acyl-carrier protein] synthase [Vibrio ziniensis]